MNQPYNQSRAFWAITRASFRAIFKEPITLLFSLLFPVIFILIFGSFGRGGFTSHRIALAPGCDTTHVLFDSIRNHALIRIIRYVDPADMKKDLEKGRLSAILNIQTIPSPSGSPRYLIEVTSTTASGNNLPLFLQTLQNLAMKAEREIRKEETESFIIKPQVYEVRKFRQIDFILPGQLGFSILFSTLFGIAFTFYNLREQLVLKRFYASPVNRMSILTGIGLSRIFFQLVNVVVLVGLGHFFMKFTLQHGLITFAEILVMSIIMLFMLMGVGLIFSSVAKSDASIPLIINLFGFPQMLLSGTFFPIDVFPKWMQPFCEVLPLTQYNDAIRKISFEGAGLIDTWREIGILGIWIAVTYIILFRVIKWE
jgi:ABC-2 type transport system permease protein